jgi:hypothetical protein
LLAASLGTVSGVVALGYGWWGTTDGFLRLSALPDSLVAVTLLVIHILAAASIVGGLVIAFGIVAGRLILLAAAVCWLLLAAVMGGGISLALGAVIVLAAAGGFVGLLASSDGLIPRRPPRRHAARSAKSAFAADEDHSRPFEPGRAEYRHPRKTQAGVSASARPRPARRSRRSSHELWLGVGAIALFLGLSAGLTYFIWSADTPRAAQTSLVSSRTPVPSAHKDENRLTNPPQPPAEAISSLPPLSELTSTAVAEVSEAAPVAGPGNGYGDPAAYCVAIGDADQPDSSQIAGGVAEVEKLATGTDPIEGVDVHWRCMNGAVWTCSQLAGGRKCEKVPTAAERVLICAANPDAAGIRTAGGVWSCDGFTPVVSPDQLTPPDERGYDRAAWRKVS